jgi:4-hydroxy-tetrahydrodipicolinate synthase
VVELTVEESAGRPVVAGTGTNSTSATVKRTLLARELGAAAALVVVPYYNKPTQAGLRQHFELIARDTGFPIILYNIPGRTGVNMTPETIAALSQTPNIVSVKEAAGSMDQVSAIVRKVPERFTVLSGDDSLSLPMYALGGKGVITTTGNVVPDRMSAIYRRFAEGEVAGARRLHYELMPLFKALFVETNPAPLKYALFRMGMMRNELRLPLVPVSVETEKAVDQALVECKVC